MAHRAVVATAHLGITQWVTVEDTAAAAAAAAGEWTTCCSDEETHQRRASIGTRHTGATQSLAGTGDALAPALNLDTLAVHQLAN